MVQVDYEMVRRVRVDKVPVARATRAFGHRRRAFYEIAATLDAGGPGTVVSGKPGPKGPTKLTYEAIGRVDAWRSTSTATAVMGYGLGVCSGCGGPGFGYVVASMT
ncbi:hypothetical protein ACIGW6_31935, partial [Kitasatospora aureofaciens]